MRIFDGTMRFDPGSAFAISPNRPITSRIRGHFKIERKTRRPKRERTPAASSRRCAAAKISPYCTPLGHAGSHPRHCTHVSSIDRTSESSLPAAPTLPLIRAIRPRGEWDSSPVTRNVGQCGRHRPQPTHAARWSSSVILNFPTEANASDSN